MEIRFYTPEMKFIGVVENHTSMVWRRKFYEPGEFKLCAPMTDDNRKLTARGNLVWIRGHKEAAVIEARTLEETAAHSGMEISGRFLSSYMDRRLIKGTYVFSGKVETAMRELLTRLDDPIPNVQLGAFNNFPETLSAQATYKNLLTYEIKLSKYADIGFRFRPDFSERTIYFETYKGVDHSRGQSSNSRVVFSEGYDNLNEMSMQENDSLLKTAFYVGGQGTGSERTIVSFGGGTGLARREVFIDARDVTKDEGMTDAEYREKLLQRGYEKQAEHQDVQAVNCMVDADSNFTYRTDYDLGDIVTVHKRKWGISMDMRITEIEEIYEQDALRISPVFGNPAPETIDWRDE